MVLSPGFPANDADTTCLPSQQLFIKSLNKIFPQLNIIVLSFQYPHLKSEYKWNNNKVIAFNGQSKAKLYRLFLWFRVWNKLKQLKYENNIIGLFSFWSGECALVGKWFGGKNNLKHYCWISGQDAKKGNKYVKWMRPAPDELIAMSDFLADEFYRNHSIRPTHIIPNGIAPEIFSDYNEQRNIDVLGVGSLIPLKQFDVFSEVIKKLTHEMPSIKAIICGKGPEENHLKLLIKHHHLENNISVIGEIEHAQVLGLMQKTRVFLHTSSYEGFPAVCIEALGAGTHVISFCRPMKAYINHWHVVNNEEEMREKAIEILQNPQTDYKPSIPYLMADAAKKVMALFQYEGDIIP